MRSPTLERRFKLSKSVSDLVEPTHLILPGVGAFGYCAKRLRDSGLLAAVTELALAQCRPVLGICVGMQLLADSSSEMGFQQGLGWMGGGKSKNCSAWAEKLKSLMSVGIPLSSKRNSGLP